MCPAQRHQDLSIAPFVAKLSRSSCCVAPVPAFDEGEDGPDLFVGQHGAERQQHDHAKLGGDTGQRDESHRGGDLHVVVEQE